jgi:membrane protein
MKKIGQILLQAGKDFGNDNAPQWAAAIAYYSLLSIFPLLLAGVSIGSFFVDPDYAIEEITRIIEEFIPEAAVEVEEIVEGAIETRGPVTVFSIAALLWSGSRVFSVVTMALNMAFDVDEHYSFFKRTLIDVVMLLTIGVFVILALVSRMLLSFLLGRVDLFGQETFLYNVLIWTIPIVLLLIAFYLIYQFVPRRDIHWKAAIIGAVVATILFAIAQPIFTSYLDEFAEFHVIYGSIAIAVILIVWAWLIACILLIGGELVSHIQMMWIEGKSAKEVERRHMERSPTHTGGRRGKVSGERGKKSREWYINSPRRKYEGIEEGQETN